MNGQRFYQQGAGTPPEYRANGTSADTRAVGDHKCPGKGAGAGNKDKTPQFMMRAMVNDAIKPAQPVSFYKTIGKSVLICINSNLESLNRLKK